MIMSGRHVLFHPLVELRRALRNVDSARFKLKAIALADLDGWNMLPVPEAEPVFALSAVDANAIAKSVLDEPSESELHRQLGSRLPLSGALHPRAAAPYNPMEFSLSMDWSEHFDPRHSARPRLRPSKTCTLIHRNLAGKTNAQSPPGTRRSCRCLASRIPEAF